MVHQIMIHIPSEKERVIPDKKFVEESMKQYNYLEIILPVTSRLGEEIEFPFVKETGKYYRGFVHEIKHKVTGSTQEIHLVIHTWHDYYYQCVKMKDVHERIKNWRS